MATREHTTVNFQHKLNVVEHDCKLFVHYLLYLSNKILNNHFVFFFSLNHPAFFKVLQKKRY